MENYIIQEYIPQPYLIDGYKFGKNLFLCLISIRFSCFEDLRIYALVTSCDPLRLFIFNNGLVRMSTEKYETPNRKNAVRRLFLFFVKLKICVLVSFIYAFDELFGE